MLASTGKKILFYFLLIIGISLGIHFFILFSSKKPKTNLINILKNGNFELAALEGWHVSESHPMVEIPLRYNYESFRGSHIDKVYKFAAFKFLDSERDQHFMTQILTSVPVVKSPLLLTFSHITDGINENAKIYQYASIRYKNGSILPVWNFAPKIENLQKFQRECIVVPYIHEIENIIAGFGGYNFDKNLKNTKGFAGITDVGIMYSEKKNMSEDEMIKLYSSKCTRIRKLKRTIDNQYKVEIDKFKSLTKPVRKKKFFLLFLENQ